MEFENYYLLAVVYFLLKLQDVYTIVKIKFNFSKKLQEINKKLS